MQTIRRAAAVLIYPAMLCLGVACDRAATPTASRPTVVPRADLGAPVQPPDWLPRALLFAGLVPDPSTALAQPDDPDDDPITVVPFEFDPFRTSLVRAFWLRGTGCPTGATVNDGATQSSFTDDACPTGDLKDKKNEGLLLAKTGPTTNFAAAGAALNGVKGIPLSELGYDIRKQLLPVNTAGSHCGAGAPRFNVVTSDGVNHFVGCNSPPAVVMGASTGWIRLRWDPATAFPPILPTNNTVRAITIIFDEAQDPSGGPDTFGLAVLDNIDVNGTLVGRGPGN